MLRVSSSCLDCGPLNCVFAWALIFAIEGEIPSWLNGSLIRLGPGKWDLKDFTLNHWLDGCAILLKFRFDRGQVWFSSRFVDSDAYRKMMSANKPVFTEFGTRAYPDPSKSVLTRMLSRIVPSDLTDNDISNIYMMNEDLFVATESCNIWKVDGKSLRAVEKVSNYPLIAIYHGQQFSRTICYLLASSPFLLTHLP